MSQSTHQRLQSRRSSTFVRAALPLCVVAAIAAVPGIARSSDKGHAAPEIVVGPMPLPNPHVKGYAYPESEQTILKHVDQGDHAWIATHAWGLWASLTRTVLPGLHVYETWQSPYDGTLISSGMNSGGATQFRTSDGRSAVFHALQRPGQFHGHHFVEQTRAEALPSSSDQVLVTVNWSPQMAKQVQANHWLSSTTLDAMLAKGESGITLNNYSVSLKPTYFWLGAPLLVQGRYYRLSTWPGPPNPAIAFPSNLWGQCVWIDTQASGAGTGTGAVDTTCSDDGSSRTPASTYGLANFIHFKLTPREASEWAKQGINVTIGTKTYAPKAGETVVLAAMHVGTREMTEWTWQTYWWQPDPNKAIAPMTAADLAARPAQVKGAAAHYAMCAAYQMVTPNQPITGGQGTKPVLCYNPYLEAPFSHNGDLPGSKPWTYQGVTYDMNVGVQTNCMSCHIQATYSKGNGSTLPYTADRYVDLDSADFKPYLKMDFSWSIQQNVKVDTPPKSPSGSGATTAGRK